MKKLIIAAVAASTLLCSFAQASLTCSYTQQVKQPFSIDLKQCFKKFVFPFNDWAYFVFPGDFTPPQNVSIRGNYLVGNVNSKQDMKVRILKRNYTLALEAEVDVHVVDKA
ncbi:MAG: hypothetical protein P1U63_06395 [Coxiellaceae bacterium]|nr:hypothetical protein [Coxiellaceae bacterium]